VNWYDAENYNSTLASGQAGLTDGSTAGQWRLPSKEELEGIGYQEKGETVKAMPRSIYGAGK